MKKMLHLFFVAIIALSFWGCPAAKDFSKTHPSDGEFEEVKTPFKDLQSAANEVIQNGGLAAVGIGLSPRQDLALDIARNDGLGKLAQVLGQQMKSYISATKEQIGTGNNPQINEVFATVTENISKQKLQGALMKDNKLTKNSSTGQYMAGALLVIDPKTFNTSLLDELKKTDQTTYNLFRESQRKKEMEKAMEKLDK